MTSQTKSMKRYKHYYAAREIPYSILKVSTRWTS